MAIERLQLTADELRKQIAQGNLVEWCITTNEDGTHGLFGLNAERTVCAYPKAFRREGLRSWKSIKTACDFAASLGIDRVMLLDLQLMAKDKRAKELQQLASKDAKKLEE